MSNWIDIAIGAGGGSATMSLIGGVLVTQMKHGVKRVVDEVVTLAIKEVKEDVSELKLKFAKETGGNSNGLRQKVDEVAKDVAKIQGFIAGQANAAQPAAQAVVVPNPNRIS